MQDPQTEVVVESRQSISNLFRTKTRIIAALLLCVSAATVTPLISAASAATPTPATWSVDTASTTFGYPELNEVSCANSTYCVTFESSLEGTQALIWNAGIWSAVPFVEQTGVYISFTGISCATQSFCMAVGQAQSSSGPRSGITSIVEEWNGSTWSIVPNPESTGSNAQTHAISCYSSAFCVAAGQNQSGGFVESWDGTSWTTTISQVGYSFEGVSCVSTSSCVLVGEDSNEQPTSLVFNGNTWSPYPVPDPGSLAALSGVSCATTTFCVASGDVTSPIQNDPLTLTEVWNGTTWSITPSPNLADDDMGPDQQGGGFLTSVSCASPSACVAVGYAGGGIDPSTRLGYPVLGMVEAWDGTSWSLTPTPAPVEPMGGGSVDFRGISCVPTRGNATCIATGTQMTAPGINQESLVLTSTTAIGSLAPTTTALTTNDSNEVTATVSPTNTSDSQLKLESQLSLSAATSTTVGGNVTILDNGLPIANCPPQDLDSASQVNCANVDTSTGTFTAAYSGDGNFNGSLSTNLTADTPPTTTTTLPTTTTTLPPTTTPPSAPPTGQPTAALPTTPTTSPAPTTTVPTTIAPAPPAAPTTAASSPVISIVSQSPAPVVRTTAHLPRIAITTKKFTLIDQSRQIPVELSCATSTCLGEASITAKIVNKITIDKKVLTKNANVTIGSMMYRLTKGNHETIDITLSPIGRSLVLNAHKPLKQELLTVTVKGGMKALRQIG